MILKLWIKFCKTFLILWKYYVPRKEEYDVTWYWTRNTQRLEQEGCLRPEYGPEHNVSVIQQMNRKDVSWALIEFSFRSWEKASVWPFRKSLTFFVFMLFLQDCQDQRFSLDRNYLSPHRSYLVILTVSMTTARPYDKVYYRGSMIYGLCSPYSRDSCLKPQFKGSGRATAQL